VDCGVVWARKKGELEVGVAVLCLRVVVYQGRWQSACLSKLSVGTTLLLLPVRDAV